jgi:hypothetical protein
MSCAGRPHICVLGHAWPRVALLQGMYGVPARSAIVGVDFGVVVSACGTVNLRV